MKMSDSNSGPNGDVRGKLQSLTKQLQEQIAGASRKGENTKIFALAERLQRVDALTQRYETICREIEELTNPQTIVSQTDALQVSLNAPSNNGQGGAESPKKYGKRLRMAWVANYGKGLKPIRGSGTLYQNSKGETVGIPVATEKIGADGPEGRWWLGLPSSQFHNAVLICEQNDKKVHAICLPKSFIEAYRGRLSKSTNGQEQFTVFKRDLNWYLQVPTIGSVEITAFLDNPNPLL